jgi:hypothetical protein
VRTTSPFATPPDRAAVWLDPELLAQISCAELIDFRTRMTIPLLTSPVVTRR